jgi:hypothetical protein
LTRLLPGLFLRAETWRPQLLVGNSSRTQVGAVVLLGQRGAVPDEIGRSGINRLADLGEEQHQAVRQWLQIDQVQGNAQITAHMKGSGN